MTKSKGVGRGGVRSGAGRAPKVAKVDWDAIGLAYFTTNKPIEDICAEHGLAYGDLLAYSISNHWVARPVKRPAHDLGDLSSALAMELWGQCRVGDRARRFVAAMVALNARLDDIAAPLQISVGDLKKEFSKELAGARA